jgi:hypothetical protein
MFPEYRAGAEQGNRFAMDGRNSLLSFILIRGDRETLWAQFGNTKMNRISSSARFVQYGILQINEPEWNLLVIDHCIRVAWWIGRPVSHLILVRPQEEENNKEKANEPTSFRLAPPHH